uniref:CDC20/Fizzy WD40 domain-containing protein n=2 Tax=Meloidogyne TaxID=189290 RepID=A0A6V7XT55_MELEN|nr:unnamed protein product [Meloidogyne enterolobii]CAD2202464.1 unnamed protein product [Meloidogyne enterolobii]
MTSRTPDWKGGANVLSAVHKISTTPSRNPNYIKGKVNEGDRYVCLRSEEQLELATHLLTSKLLDDENATCLDTSMSCPTSPATKLEQKAKRQMMRVKSDNNLDNGIEGDRVCAFRKGLAPIARFGHRAQQTNVLFHCIQPSSTCIKRSRRYIVKEPERMLDAPSLLDDFYTNLIDWSKANVVAVTLGNKIFQWNAATGAVDELKDFENLEANPTVAKWSKEGQYIAIGFSDGTLKLIDSISKNVLRTIRTEGMRLACACWTGKGELSCGSRNGKIYHHDVRMPKSLISVFSSHSSEVCGLKWSPDEHFLTSGGSDCLVHVWEKTQLSNFNAPPLYRFDDHIAAVKAIEYVPQIGLGPSNLVATGGGTRDHTIRFWDLNDGMPYFTLDTQSQITGILFNKLHSEMITGHGAPKAGVRVWHHEPNKIKKFEPTAELNNGQGGRALSLCQSPCGEYVMTASQDEVLRIWHVWKVDESMRKQSQENVTANARKQLQYALNGHIGVASNGRIIR